MSAQDPSTTSTPDHRPEVPHAGNSQPKHPKMNLLIAGAGLTLVLSYLLQITTFFYVPPKDWIEVVLAGLIIGLALGTVFGLWIGRIIGHDPSPKTFVLATGIIILNACVGFFGFSFLTGHGLWPDDDVTLGWSIATAGTLVSAAILCLVNFYYHSRDQKRIHMLRAVLNKTRARIAEAEAKIAAAQARADQASALADQHLLRAENAERQADEQRGKAELAQRDAEHARTSAQHAQHIAEKEKRWRSHRNLLVGRWQCIEYSARGRNLKEEAPLQLFSEPEHDRDVFQFGSDESFVITHPGKRIGLLDKLKISVSSKDQPELDLPREASGRWQLDDIGETLTLRYLDGKHESLKIRTLTDSKLTVDRSNEQWELLRFLVRIG